MSGPDGDALLGTAESLVAKARSAGAEQAEVYLSCGASLGVDVEDGAVVAGESVQDRGGSVRLVREGRLGFAYFSDPAEAGRAIEEALRASRHAPRRGYGLPSGGPLPDLPSQWDDRHAGLDPGDALEAARQLVQGVLETCPDARVTGGTSIGWGLEALASSEGVAAGHRATRVEAGASLTVEDDGAALAVWDHDALHKGSLDVHALGGRIGTTAGSLRRPLPAVAGSTDVVLLPDAASELVGNLVTAAVDGDTAMRGKSVWSDHLGETVAHAGLTILDDPLRADGLGSTPMDGEGLAAHRQPIIEAGALTTFLFDSWDAHKHGQDPTHSAVRGGYRSTPSTGAHQLVVEHRDTRSLDDLMAGMEEGYVVESVLGAHTANATTGDFSVTAPNVWRVEDGRRGAACKEIALGGNLPELLGRLDAVSDAPRTRDGAVMPALRFRDVQVST